MFKYLGALPFILVMALVGQVKANITVEGALAHTFDVRPGAVLENSITIANVGTEDMEVRIYQTDYTFSVDGGVAYPEPGTVDRSNSTWISVTSAPTLVRPGERSTVTYRVEVPYEDLRGSYWSLIMVEGSPREQPEDAAGVRTVVRYGVQVVTTVDAQSPAELLFVNPAFSVDEAGRAYLQVDVVNDGVRSLRPLLYVDLFDPKGAAVGRFEGELHRLHPGTSIRQTFDLGPFEPGAYLAIVVADAGGGDVFGAQYNLNVGSD